MTPLDDTEFEATMLARRRPAPGARPETDQVGHYLVMLEGAEPGRRVEVTSVPITIGRSPNQMLAFSDAELSRQHSRVTLIGGEVVAEDLGSTNGTYVDQERITRPVTLREGSMLRMGSQFFRYERRDRRDVERGEELDREILKASHYVLKLLPAPLNTGPVQAGWRFIPSARLGGDAFGYGWLDPDTFMIYLLDVSGHGVGSAMHSVTVLNVLRQRALPDVDFRDPGSVLSSLNHRFQMDAHNGLFFTIWYGVYRPADRSLVYSSAGHHPAFLVAPDRQIAEPLGTPALMIGAFPDASYEVQRATILPGSTMYLFSDGVFEIQPGSDERWGLQDFLPLLLRDTRPGIPEADRLYDEIRQIAGPGALDDDFSLVVAGFA